MQDERDETVLKIMWLEHFDHRRQFDAVDLTSIIIIIYVTKNTTLKIYVIVKYLRLYLHHTTQYKFLSVFVFSRLSLWLVKFFAVYKLCRIPNF